MSKQAWIIFAAIVVVGLGALIYMSRGDAIDVSSIDHTQVIATEDQVEEVNSGLKDPIYGNPDAKTTVMVYADYSCGGCAAFNERIMGVAEEEEYKDNIRIIHRHFPIKTIHPNSFSAAAYAEAIGLQDEEAFWEFSDRLYKNQSQWVSAQPKDRDDIILSYASGLDVDLDKVRDDVSNTDVTRKINFDAALGRANGVQATPTVFIDGELADTSEISDSPGLRKALDASIKENSGSESNSNDEDKEATKEKDSNSDD